MGLNRDQIIKIARLTGCKNFVGKREKCIFNVFVDLKPVEWFENGSDMKLVPFESSDAVSCSPSIVRDAILYRLQDTGTYCRNFVFKQDSTSFTPHCRLRSNVPQFIEPENWPPNSLDLNPADYSVWSVAAGGVSSQNVIRHWWAEASSGRLMGSAKPGHTKPSDWSTTKKTDDGYQGIE